MNARLFELVQAVADAEAEAFTEHLLGRCHLSEWSCSYCEPDLAPDRRRDDAHGARILYLPVRHAD